MARLFLALPLPPKLRHRLHEETDRLRLAGAEVAWVKEENYHVTVRFLGEVADADLLHLDPVFRDAAAQVPPLKLVAKGLGWFPERGHEDTPRVVWCGIAGEEDAHFDALQQLQRTVEAAIRPFGFRREKGPYRPHITLGRVRSPHNAPELVSRMGPGQRREFGHFVCREIALIESRLTKVGPEYTALQGFPLAT